MFGMFWSLVNQSDVDGCHEVSRRVGLEPGVALEVNLNGVPHCHCNTNRNSEPCKARDYKCWMHVIVFSHKDGDTSA